MADRGKAEASGFGLFLLLAAVFAAAACAIVYELLIGSTSSYFLGDSVEQFSLTIGFFLFAMGVGSWLSRLIRQELLARFIALEIWLGLIGGCAVAVLYLAYGHSSHYRYWMLMLIVAIGVLVGLEVPLLSRILRSYGSLRTTLSTVLSMDYFGALAAALLFPYLLMPLLGGFHTSVLAGWVNLSAGVAVLLCFRTRIRTSTRRWLMVQGGGAGLVLAGLWAGSGPLLDRWESSFYADRIVHSEQSPYQKIVLTLWRDDLRLFLDGHLQFASVDEHRYHEAMVHPALAVALNRERVLVIGGGDGLSVREILKYSDVSSIDLVDLDPAVTTLSRRNPHLTRLNKNALNGPKVRIFNDDGFTFLQREHTPYGAIVIDLPDPREEALAKLYSVEGYRLCLRHLAPGGVLVTQGTSPYFTREAYWSIAATLEEAGFEVCSYHVHVPSFGEWGFHLASRDSVDLKQVEFEVPRRFLRKELLEGMLFFDPDMSRVKVESNRLDRPSLARFYRSGWERW